MQPLSSSSSPAAEMMSLLILELDEAIAVGQKEVDRLENNIHIKANAQIVRALKEETQKEQDRTIELQKAIKMRQAEIADLIRQCCGEALLKQEAFGGPQVEQLEGRKNTDDPAQLGPSPVTGYSPDNDDNLGAGQANSSLLSADRGVSFDERTNQAGGLGVRVKYGEDDGRVNGGAEAGAQGEVKVEVMLGDGAGGQGYEKDAGKLSFVESRNVTNEYVTRYVTTAAVPK
ncbi:hypothetical protein FRC01_011962 [Tulasnella sp. 417]|nr:hypothetical protein FRC01_011962 [Tulasnella sp. 417]